MRSASTQYTDSRISYLPVDIGEGAGALYILNNFSTTASGFLTFL